MIGCSYGGYFTLYTMAADTRIKVGYSIAAFNDKDYYSWVDWSYFKSAQYFQDAEVVALCVPRRLFVQVGKKDEVFNYEHALAEVERASEYYKEQGCSNNFVFSLWDGGHTMPDEDEGVNFLFATFEE